MDPGTRSRQRSNLREFIGERKAGGGNSGERGNGGVIREGGEAHHITAFEDAK